MFADANSAFINGEIQHKQSLTSDVEASSSLIQTVEHFLVIFHNENGSSGTAAHNKYLYRIDSPKPALAS